MNTSVTPIVDEAVAAAGKEVLSAKLEGMVSDFVDQVGSL